jgi:transcription-repair coupling factor (superfamily II helicase)
MTHSIFSPPLPHNTLKTKNDVRHWGNLQGSSTALILANAAKLATGPILLVTADTPSAIKLEKELDYFLQGRAVDVQLFPDWETLPYDNFSPHQDIVSQRLETLYQLTQNERRVFIVPINTLMMRMAPVDYISKYLLILKINQKINIDDFRSGLERAGYLHVNQVMGHSEFSIRGSIIDLFPMGSQHPYRIDLFDDEVDTIRHFNPETQRSGEKVDEIKLLPAREFPTDKDASLLFRQQYLGKFAANNTKESIYYQVGKGLMPGGIEYYLPLFFEKTATLFDYLNQDTTVLMHGDLQSAHENHWKDVNHRYEQLRYNLARPLLHPADIFMRYEELFSALKEWPRLLWVT